MTDTWTIPQEHGPADGEIIAQQARRIERLEMLIELYESWLESHCPARPSAGEEDHLAQISDYRERLGLKNV